MPLLIIVSPTKSIAGKRVQQPIAAMAIERYFWFVHRGVQDPAQTFAPNYYWAIPSSV